jgi:hypothetical protein
MEKGGREREGERERERDDEMGGGGRAQSEIASVDTIMSGEISVPNRAQGMIASNCFATGSDSPSS